MNEKSNSMTLTIQGHKIDFGAVVLIFAVLNFLYICLIMTVQTDLMVNNIGSRENAIMTYCMSACHNADYLSICTANCFEGASLAYDNAIHFIEQQ